MTELKSLRAEELEFSYRQELIEHPEAATTRYLDLRAELLRRLQPEGLADFKIHKFPDNRGEHGPAVAHSSSAGPEPRCPKCQSRFLQLCHGDEAPHAFVRCNQCGEMFVAEKFTDFAQFFPASQQVPGINWQNLYQHTEDALLALRIELGGSDYKTNALDHIAVIRRQLAASQQVELPENSMRCIECKAKICDHVFKRLCDFRAASQQVDVSQLTRTIIERVAKDAVMLAIVRSQLEWDEALEQTDEDIAADAVKVCTGDEMGCLAEEDATPENATHVFVAAVLQKAMGATQWVNRDNDWAYCLSIHWLHAIQCNHEARTDESLCVCGWRSKSQPTVGLAVGEWIMHVQGQMGINQPPERGAATPEEGKA